MEKVLSNAGRCSKGDWFSLLDQINPGPILGAAYAARTIPTDSESPWKIQGHSHWIMLLWNLRTRAMVLIVFCYLLAGILKLVRDQEEGRVGASGQV